MMGRKKKHPPFMKKEDVNYAAWVDRFFKK